MRSAICPNFSAIGIPRGLTQGHRCVLENTREIQILESCCGIKVSRVSEFTTVRLTRTWDMLRTMTSLIHASFKVPVKFRDPEIYMAGTPVRSQMYRDSEYAVSRSFGDRVRYSASAFIEARE